MKPHEVIATPTPPITCVFVPSGALYARKKSGIRINGSAIFDKNWADSSGGEERRGAYIIVKCDDQLLYFVRDRIKHDKLEVHIIDRSRGVNRALPTGPYKAAKELGNDACRHSGSTV